MANGVIVISGATKNSQLPKASRHCEALLESQADLERRLAEFKFNGDRLEDTLETELELESVLQDLKEAQSQLK